ncbi:MAG: FtsX-like permease family protein, partial [Vicinamibacteria bacterium]
QRAQGFAAVVRTDGRPEALTSAAREAVRRVDPQIAVTTAESIETRVAEALAPARFLSWLSGSFAVMAFLLAIIDIYAVLAHAVRRQQREIGIRAALGATRQGLVARVVGQGVMLVGAGLGAGLALAWGLSGILETWLYGVGQADPVSYASVALASLVAAVLASLVPAIRAVRVDPMVILRND